MTTVKTAPTDAQKVMMFPAQAKPLAGKQVYFLFSLNQMADVLTATTVREIPFSPPYVKGITEWRGHVFPVIVLEKMLGLEASAAEEENRLAVVRSSSSRQQENNADSWGIIRISHGLKMVALPNQYTAANHSLPCDPKNIRAIYDWEEGIIIVPHMENILSGKIKTGAPHVQ